jgi:hypothetical protein
MTPSVTFERAIHLYPSALPETPLSLTPQNLQEN